MTTESSATNLAALRALRTLRAFRPLRAVSRWRGMRVVMDALVFCIPSIANVLLVCMLFWLVFAIMAVNFFGGQFGYCEDADGNKLMTQWEHLPTGNTYDVTKNFCVNQTLQTTFSQNFKWIVPSANFDNVLFALISLFQVATFEGWMEIIASAMDCRGVEAQPLYKSNTTLAYIFFYIFIIIGSFFILNLIVGVIIESFQQLSKSANMSAIEAIMTEDQRKFVTAVRALFSARPKKICPKPETYFRKQAWIFVLHPYFELTIFIVIMLNMFLLASEGYGISNNAKNIILYLDICFTIVFVLEATIKYFALQMYYFIDPFNVFDFLICLISLVGIGLELADKIMVSANLVRIVRVFRVFRILRAVRAARGIRRLMITLIVSLPALGNIAILILVFIIIYAILGMQFFMYMPLIGSLNDVVNFQTFPTSAIILLRLMTGAGWNDVFDSLLADNKCTTDRIDCGQYALVSAYFITFIFIVFLVIINTYIAVILDNFADLFEQEKLGITNEDLDNFYATWSRYDPDATQFVSADILPDLLHELPIPLKVSKPNSVKIAALNLPILPKGKVHCLDVLSTLVRIIIGEGVELPDSVVKQAEKSLERNFPERIGVAPITSTMQERQRHLSAKVIQRWWRIKLRRRKNKMSLNDPMNLLANTVNQLTRNSNFNSPDKDNTHSSNTESKNSQPPKKSKSIFSRPTSKKSKNNHNSTEDSKNNNNNKISSNLPQSSNQTSSEVGQISENHDPLANQELNHAINQAKLDNNTLQNNIENPYQGHSRNWRGFRNLEANSFEKFANHHSMVLSKSENHPFYGDRNHKVTQEIQDKSETK